MLSGDPQVGRSSVQAKGAQGVIAKAMLVCWWSLVSIVNTKTGNKQNRLATVLFRVATASLSRTGVCWPVRTNIFMRKTNIVWHTGGYPATHHTLAVFISFYNYTKK